MKLKLLILVLIFNSVFIFSQEEKQNYTSSKRIKIDNPTEDIIHTIKKTGIDLRCGAIIEDNSLKLELNSSELEHLRKVGVSYTVEIEDLTSFYAERAAKDLPIAKAQLKIAKAKKTQESSKSILNVLLDNQLQYYGPSEVDWQVPSNFVLGSMGGCLTVSETLAQLDLMRTLYPSIISVKTDASPTNQTTYGNSTGTSWSGQTIYYVKISDDPYGADDVTEPDILYTSMIHSRELSALMGNIYYMWYLLENYATDPGIKSLVDNNELFFVPIVNPDGLRWNEVIAPSGGGMQRKNLRPGVNDDGNTSSNNSGRGVDLNRNFDYFWGSAGDPSGSSNNETWDSYRGPSAASEPETQIMRDFILSKNFKTAVWQHSYSNAIPHPYGGIPTKVSGREDEMHKWHEDMTKYNRYVSGATIFSAANGIADDWMLGGTEDTNGSNGSGMNILATTPENGHGTEGGFWPSTSDIVPIAKRMMRINFMNAYYGGAYAKLHDLTQSDIQTLTSDLTFGIERLGQTASDFTLTVTPISSNIQSVTSPATQSGMTVLEQRNITAQLVLNAGTLANEKIEYKVSLSNGSFIMYEANFEKYYQPTVLFSDNPDEVLYSLTDNWTSSGTWTTTTADSFSGTTAIKDGNAIPYANNSDRTLTTTSSYDLTGADEILVQFYTKWDLERNFDFVELWGSTDGSSWQSLSGKYNKPNSTTNTNDSHGGKSGISHAFQDTDGSLYMYDGDQFDNWVLEEIVIDVSNNSFLVNANTAYFQFVFRTDSSNLPENYSTLYEGFFIDDFKIIQTPCETSTPFNVVASAITSNGATIDWNLISAVQFDVRYREVSTSTWTDVTGLSINNYQIVGLSPSTNYEVQVTSTCNAQIAPFSVSTNFTTSAQVACTGTPISSYPYSESFESGIGVDWIQGTNGSDDDIDWTHDSAGTPSNGTGPSSASDGTEYLYTEASTNVTPEGSPDKSAELISPCFDLTGYKNAQFSFDYHMFGTAMGTLTLEVSVDNGATYNNLITLSGQQHGSNGDAWTTGNANLTAYSGQTIKLKFSGTTGGDYTSDMAIDNFSLTAEVDTPLGIEDEILSEFVLYPNPVKGGEIKLNVPREITDFNVMISNVLGQTVYENKISDNYNTAHTVNTSNLKQGIYFVTVSTNLGMATKKMVIQ